MFGFAVMQDWLGNKSFKRLKRADEKYCVYYTEKCTCFVERTIVTDVKVLVKWFRDKLNQSGLGER